MKLNDTIHIRLSSEEKKRIKMIARYSGLSISEYARAKIFNRLEVKT